MTLDSLLRSYVNDWHLVRKIAKFLSLVGFSPNLLSIISFILAIFVGLFFFLSSYSSHRSLNPLLLLAGLFLCISASLDAIDGILARETGKASKKGDFLDHTLDRYSDVFIICGIFFGGYITWEIGVIAVVGVLMSSYLGTQAEAVGLKRVYGGILGRADRLLLIIVATFLNVLYPYPFPSQGMSISFTFLGWAVLIIAFLSHITALQRFFHTWRRL
ncbi:MAG: CDP-alcohol phosphatidyltransferase family protein [Candidatus Methanospirareceae archaeon]